MWRNIWLPRLRAFELNWAIRNQSTSKRQSGERSRGSNRTRPVPSIWSNLITRPKTRLWPMRHRLPRGRDPKAGVARIGGIRDVGWRDRYWLPTFVAGAVGPNL